MRSTVLIPFLLAPVIGVLIAVQLFERSENSGGTREESGAQARNKPSSELVQAPAMQSDGERSAGGFAFTDLMSIMRKGGAAVSAPELHAAFQAVLTQAPGEARTQALRTAFTKWVLETPAEALAHIDSIPGEDRRTIVATALAALARQHPERFQRYVNEIGQDSGAVLTATLSAISEKHPAEALAWIKQHPELDTKGELTAAVLPGLIHSGIALAAQTVASMNDRAPVSLIQQVAVSYAKQDPAQAYQWVGQVIKDRSDASPTQLLNDVSSSLAASYPAEAASYLNRASDPAVRKSLMNEIAIRKGQEDLGAAWNWLSQYGGDPNYSEAAQNLLYRWSYTKPQEVAQILTNVSNQEVQTVAVAHLSRFWQQRDQAAYQAWLASLPPGSLKTAALSAR